MTESPCPGRDAERPVGRAPESENIVVDCAQVIAEVWTLLDGECTPDNQHVLRQHLQQCPECLGHYGIEQRLKALIARKCGSEKMPEGLRERVRWEISQTTMIRRRG
ncbi:MAG: mycothiol system anti-sigma-R factor [Mycobacteriaceae bacterium]|nr:mycothiol system anti-sigma-R factor [Mycobacteriaceae bacterium]